MTRERVRSASHSRNFALSYLHFMPFLDNATVVCLPLDADGEPDMAAVRSATPPEGPVVVLIGAAEALAFSGAAPAGVAVVAPGEWTLAVSVLDRVARGFAGRGTALTLLVPWQAPPERFPRNDGSVRSFAASYGLFQAASAEVDSLEDACYRALWSALSSAGTVVDHLTVVHMGAPGATVSPAADVVEAALIVPHRGSMTHLEVCLGYLARQTAQPARVQVCFDEEITPAHEALMERAPGVEYFATEPCNVGPYIARHTLGLRSPEEVVVWHDSDDASCSDRLAVSFAEMQRRGLELMGCHELRLDEIDGRVEAIRFPLTVTAALDIGPAHALFHPTSLVRREALRRAHGFSTAYRFGSDAHFLYRAYFHLQRIENLDAFLYIRRLRPNSLTTGPETRWASPEREKQRGEWRHDFERVRTGAAPIEETSLWPAHADPMPLVRALGSAVASAVR